MKKFLSLFLSILLLLAVVPVFSVSAANNPAFVVSNANASVGDKVEITVSAENNPGIISLQVSIEYDKNALKLVSTKDGKFKGVTYSPEKNIPFLVTWMDPLKPNNTTNGVITTLEFEVLETAPNGKSEITLSYNPDNVFEYNTSAKDNFKNVDFAIQNGYVDIKNSDAPEQPVTSSQESKPEQNNSNTASQSGSGNTNSTASQENVYEQIIEDLLTSSNNAQGSDTGKNTSTATGANVSTKTESNANTENITITEDSSDSVDAQNGGSQKGWLLWVVIAAVVLLGGAFAVVIIINKKK